MGCHLSLKLLFRTLFLEVFRGKEFPTSWNSSFLLTRDSATGRGHTIIVVARRGTVKNTTSGHPCVCVPAPAAGSIWAGDGSGASGRARPTAPEKDARSPPSRPCHARCSASRSVCCWPPAGVAPCGGGPRACRPSPRRCTCGARTRCGTRNPRRRTRPPSRCCSRRTCAPATCSAPSNWPGWPPTCSGRAGCSATPDTSRSATSTTPTCSSGSSPRR